MFGKALLPTHILKEIDPGAISGILAFACNGQLVLWGMYVFLYSQWSVAFEEQTCCL